MAAAYLRLSTPISPCLPVYLYLSLSSPISPCLPLYLYLSSPISPYLRLHLYLSLLFHPPSLYTSICLSYFTSPPPLYLYLSLLFHPPPLYLYLSLLFLPPSLYTSICPLLCLPASLHILVRRLTQRFFSLRWCTELIKNVKPTSRSSAVIGSFFRDKR